MNISDSLSVLYYLESEAEESILQNKQNSCMDYELDNSTVHSPSTIHVIIFFLLS